MKHVVYKDRGEGARGKRGEGTVQGQGDVAPRDRCSWVLVYGKSELHSELYLVFRTVYKQAL